MNVARHIPRIALCLLAGVVVSYGVAWWFAYRLSQQWWLDDIEYVSVDPNHISWPFAVSLWPNWISPDHVAAVPSSMTVEYHSVGGRTTTYAACVDRLETAVHETSLGWPARSTARYTFTQQPPFSSPSWIPEDKGLLYAGWYMWDTPSMLNPTVTKPVRLPVKPLWGGLAINSMFYGTFAYAGLAGLGWVVRANRRRRGLCEVCKYPRGVSATCTECGRAHGTTRL